MAELLDGLSGRHGAAVLVGEAGIGRSALAGGPACSSGEASVMEVERRGRVIRGCVRSINQAQFWEESRGRAEVVEQVVRDPVGSPASVAASIARRARWPPRGRTGARTATSGSPACRAPGRRRSRQGPRSAAGGPARPTPPRLTSHRSVRTGHDALERSWPPRGHAAARGFLAVRRSAGNRVRRSARPWQPAGDGTAGAGIRLRSAGGRIGGDQPPRPTRRHAARRADRPAAPAHRGPRRRQGPHPERRGP